MDSSGESWVRVLDTIINRLKQKFKQLLAVEPNKVHKCAYHNVKWFENIIHAMDAHYFFTETNVVQSIRDIQPKDKHDNVFQAILRLGKSPETM